ALSRRLVEKIRSPLVPLWGSQAEDKLSIVDARRTTNPEYVMQIAGPDSQLLEVSVYDRPWGAAPGIRLLAEWLKHHLACEVFLGSSYGRPWIPLDAPTIASNDQSFIRMFCEDTGGASCIGLPWPENTATATPAVIAARFGANRFDPALESLID